MHRLRTLVIGSALGTLALGAVVAPVGAGDTKGTLAIVNGIPGKHLDVCLNGDEIKSNLAYGGHVFQNDKGTGPKSLKFYEHDPRQCKGTRVGQTSFTLDPAEDLTIVATKREPKILTFDNVGLGEIPPRGAPAGSGYLAVRNASELPVNLRSKVFSPNPETPFFPNADPVFAKGRQQKVTGLVPGFIWKIRARLPESVETLDIVQFEAAASHRYDVMLVGSTSGNAQLVLLDRIVSLPSP